MSHRQLVLTKKTRMLISPLNRLPGTVLDALVLVAVSSLLAAGCSASGSVDRASGTSSSTSISNTTGSSCQPGEIDGDLNLYMREGSVPGPVIEAFEVEYGVQVLADTYTSNESVEPKLVSGAAYDVVATTSDLVGLLADEQLIRRIDSDLAPNLENVRSFFSNSPNAPDGAYSASYRWGTLGIGVNLESIEPQPGWATLFEAALVADYPRGVALLDDGRLTMAAALMSLGYSPNTTIEAQLAEAADLIAGLGASIRFESDSFVAMLDSGAVDAVLGRSEAFENSSEAVSFLIPAEGTIAWIDSLVIPQEADHVCTSHVFIDFVLSDDQGPALTDWSSFASTRVDVRSYLDPETFEEVPGIIANPAATLDILSDSRELDELYESYLDRARRSRLPASS